MSFRCVPGLVALLLGLSVSLGSAQTGAPAAGPDVWRAEVFAAERAFARSMAERDIAAFARLVAEDTLFFGGRNVLRGKAAVLEGWKAFFDGPNAPFSWEPDQVEVLASGQLALSTGPVRNPQGEPIARFNSIWQRQPDGRWLVIFDKGSPPDPARP
jgi:ketosteroid isomerase-like protein